MAVFAVLLLSCNRPRHDWRETYDPNSKEPYGLHVCKTLLSSYVPGHDMVDVKDDFSILTAGEGPSNYVFIGEGFLFTEEEKIILQDYLRAGNTVLLISKVGSVDLLEYLDLEDCGKFLWEPYSYTFTYDTLIYLDFEAPELSHPEDGYPAKFYFNGKVTNRYQWTVFPASYECDSTNFPVVLGYLEDEANFMLMDSSLHLYLHSTPLAFTNFSFLEESGVEYAERVFSYLKPGPIYFETQRQVPEEVVNRKNTPNQNLPEKSPLSYILSQPSLASAWYVLLIMTVLYLIFRAKRRQRVIPVVEPNENTSLEFVETIGKLYFQKGNPRDVALQKMRFLQADIRDRYQVKNKDWSDETLQQIHLKSGVEKDLLEKIRTMYTNISTSRLTTEKTLADFHFLLEEFYRNRN
ncbi:MAG: hypothetical protein KDC24_02730 [Saprospiraceae bacterium]|nr:hypothetical protein [Saprospiraceae bacterium]